MMIKRFCLYSTWVFMCAVLLFSSSTILATDGDWRLLNKKEQDLLLIKLADLQQSIKTFQGEFKEERTTKALKVPIHFEGRIYYDVQGLFFMQYLKPVKHILRVKGGEALFYVEGSKTADVADLTNMNGAAKKANLFAWNPAEFKGRIWTSKTAYRLEDSSRDIEEKKEGRKIIIFLNKQTLYMERIRIEDEFGDVTEILLSKQRVNEELPLSILHFSLPKGTKINRMINP
ncbi:outer membrane lipoprotein carrier protein LolA [Thermodesulfobacteriota bacterium]